MGTPCAAGVCSTGGASSVAFLSLHPLNTKAAQITKAPEEMILIRFFNRSSYSAVIFPPAVSILLYHREIFKSQAGKSKRNPALFPDIFMLRCQALSGP
jgi:hypothetical protein